MGGIGTGGFNVFTDGGVGLFRSNHNWFKSIGRCRYPKGSFWALRCDDGERTITRILRRSYRGGSEYPGIESIAHTSFTGELPFFRLDFEDAALPVRASLTGFTPLIPHNSKDSSLPAALLQMHLSNPTGAPISCTLLSSFENILGIGGSGGRAARFPLDGPVRYNRSRGNYAEPFSTPEAQGLRFATRQDYSPRNPRRRVIGEYLLFTDTASLADARFSACTGWHSGRRHPELLRRFVRSGSLPKADARGGKSGAFTLSCTLQPGESRSINLYLLWWTPHHVIEKRQRLRRLTGRHRGRDYGHYYLNYFSSGSELASYCIRERERLARESGELLELVKSATLPAWLKRYILNSADSVLVNTVLPKDGTLYTMEGVPWRWLFGALTGTVDQRLASHPYTATFFPELDRSELLTFFRLAVDGRVPHGNGNADIALGSHDVPYGNPIKSFNQTEDWTDLPQSLILQTGKTILQSGDTALLRDRWPEMLAMIDFLNSTMQDEIPEGITTYDYMHYHPSFIYTAILHCATLAMMIELGSQLASLSSSPREQRELAARIDSFRTQLQRTRASCNALLWDERGFFHSCYTRPTIFTAALAGDWISRLAGLGPVVDYAQARSHSEWQFRVLVDAYPYMDSRAGITRPLVYREADPSGRELPAVSRYFVLNKVNNPWQSAGFQAIEAIFLGRTAEGLRLIKRIWEKGWYEGYPWDMDHWGMRGNTYITHPIFWLWWDRDHLGTRGHVYMTHPVLWSVFNALTGVSYHAFTETLTVAPRPLPDQEEFRIPVFLPRFWLMVEYEESSGRISLRVLKRFGEVSAVRRLLYLEPDGSIRELAIGGPKQLEEGLLITSRI
jgi:uncharacterized protein (DUF608 family)